jgi:hypothetical protein
VGLDKHLGETVYREKKRVLEIQLNLKRSDAVEFLPDGLADDLGGFLIIPAPGASEIPLGMDGLRVNLMP